MTLAEAYAAIDAVAKPNQAVFITTQCHWYSQASGPRGMKVDFTVSLVPGFDTSCDQWGSVVSLQAAVDKCLAAAAEAAAAPAAINTAESFVADASVNAQALELVDDDIPY